MPKGSLKVTKGTTHTATPIALRKSTATTSSPGTKRAPMLEMAKLIASRMKKLRDATKMRYASLKRNNSNSWK